MGTLIPFVVLHFTVGRSASLVYAVIAGLPALLYLPLAILFDLLQLAGIGFALEVGTSWGPVRWFVGRIRRRLDQREQRLLLRGALNLGNPGLVVLSALPITGFGIFSSAAVAFLLGKSRAQGTALIMLGSVLGCLLVSGLMESLTALWQTFWS